MVLEASPILYKATENRAFFESVHILIPELWSNIEANFSTWETFDVRKNKNHATAMPQTICFY